MLFLIIENHCISAKEKNEFNVEVFNLVTKKFRSFGIAIINTDKRHNEASWYNDHGKQLLTYRKSPLIISY